MLVRLRGAIVLSPVVLFCSLLHASLAAAQPLHVQAASGNDHYNTAFAPASFASSVAAGNAIAVLCAWTSASQTLTGVTDTQGNAYTIVDNPTSGTYGRAAMAYAIAGASGADTVTCRFSSSSMGKSILVHEIAGINATTPLDGHRMSVKASPGSGANALTSGAITTTASDYILGFTFNASSNQATSTSGTGYTKRQDLQIQPYSVASEDWLQSSPGAIAATFTVTSASFGEFITGVLAFQPGQTVNRTLQSIDVTPSTASIGVGATQPFTATGTFSDGSTQNLTSVAAWTSSDTGVATINAAGVANAAAVGTTTIQAAFSGVSGSADLTVTVPPITVTVSPATANVQWPGGTRQFTATIMNDAENGGVTWTLSGSGCSGSGCGTLSAGFSASGSPITFTAPATAPTPPAVVLTATSVTDTTRTSSASISLGAAFAASMYIDFEGAADGATINGSVLAASTRCGNGTWSFTNNPMTGMTISTTANRPLVSPVTACGTTYTGGGNTRGLRYDMRQTSRYAAYNWTTTSNSASAGFFYKIGVVDSNWYSVFAITAHGGDFTMLHMHGGAMYLETWAGITNAIPIAPNTWYWITMQYNAGGTHYMNVYETTNWTLLGSASNVSTGNYKPDGIEIGRTGNEPGYPASYWYYDQIVIDYERGTFPILQGTPATLTSIAVTPSHPSIPKGATQAFAATGTYSDGTSRNVTSMVGWGSSSLSIAAINAAGVATGTGTGTSTIQATSGSVAGSTTLTVTPAVLSSIAVTPANASMLVGTTQPFTATGTYSDGTTQDVTGTATWSSSNPAVATITGSGVASGSSAGAATIQATSGSVSGSTSLTVTSTPSTTVGYVQSASANDHYSTASASARFAGNVTATNAIAVFCAWTSVSQTLASVTDTQGNTYTIVDNPTGGTSGRAAMAYTIARASGVDTVSCNFSSGSMGKSILLHEISGVSGSAPLDGHRMTARYAPGTGANAITSGSITTTTNGDYIVGFTFNDSGNQADWNAGTGYTRRQDFRVASYTAASEDRIQPAAGAVSATFGVTAAGYGDFITGILAFRPR